MNVGPLIYFITYVPYGSFNDKFARLGFFTKLMFCLPINSGMSQGIFQILRLELDGEGLQFSNFFRRMLDIEFSFGEVFIVQVFAMFLHILLMLYIDQICPGEYGVPKKWSFPFKACLTVFRRNKIDNEDDYSSINSDAFREVQKCTENFEEEPDEITVGIQICNLSKQFGTKMAVNRLNLNMYQGQITALLGQNGAGKTTTMSMLTGMIQPTLGTAYVNGKDIRYSMDEARKSIGLCPQHNILFDELTVEEHFKFFCRLKGIKNDRHITNETNNYISRLELEEKRDSLAKELSGGMKRKLSIGIALCGGSKIVICDEPTSGMDSAARRALWNLLLEEKKNRTILFTTHFLEEADILGDRIAIMVDGELKTVGSSYFLKKRFGTGYKIICEKGSFYESNAVFELLKSFVPDVKIVTDSHEEVTFNIPEEYLPSFREIFKSLEDNADKFDISSFGCSLTTLEEVFLKIGTDEISTESNFTDEFDLNDLGDSFSDCTRVDFEQMCPSKKVNGLPLLVYQFEGIILKKFCYLRRNYAPFIWYGFLSIWLIYIILAETVFEFSEPQSLNITLESYKSTVTLLESDEDK